MKINKLNDDGGFRKVKLFMVEIYIFDLFLIYFSFLQTIQNDQRVVYRLVNCMCKMLVSASALQREQYKNRNKENAFRMYLPY